MPPWHPFASDEAAPVTQVPGVAVEGGQAMTETLTHPCRRCTGLLIPRPPISGDFPAYECIGCGGLFGREVEYRAAVRGEIVR